MNPANGTTTIVAGATILQAHDLVLSFGETQPFAERTSRWKPVRPLSVSSICRLALDQLKRQKAHMSVSSRCVAY